MIKLKGIDLVDTFPVPDKKLTCVQFESKSLIEWVPEQTYDLITCVHGLHYLGDKLKVIITSINALHPSGLFVANFDLSNIVIQGAKTYPYLKNIFKQYGIDYNPRLKILKRIGTTGIRFDLKYMGADDGHGPNYTGQDSVTSYYAV